MAIRGARVEPGTMRAVWDQTCAVRPQDAPENGPGTSERIVAATTPNQTSTDSPA
ncbi:hypothetical protein ACGF8B_40050 [Streptomyces sp. NPDC047917]|uniref:hypothetical protein n=1 Tax=Streptomyces sp. NPDC047917 TaxID=3365491 RepID=UPI00371DAAE3